MFKIVRQQQAIQRAIREARNHATRNYSNFLRKQTPRLNNVKLASIRKMATGSGGGSNDVILIGAGLGILGATCVLGYYATNTQYVPDISTPAPEPIEQEPIEESVLEEGSMSPSEEVVVADSSSELVSESASTLESKNEPESESVPEPVSESFVEASHESTIEEPAQPKEESSQEQPEAVKEYIVDPSPIEPVIEVTEEATSIVEVPQAEEKLSGETKKFPEVAAYVIIGAGTASHAACRAIRKNDPNAKILVIGEENALPYMRPPLSKELWFSEDENVGETLIFKSWNGKERSVFFEKDGYYTKVEDFGATDKAAVSVLTGDKVTNVDSEGHQITLASGESVKYGKLLIATGGTPKEHKAFTDDAVKTKTTLFRNISDFKNLNNAVKDAEHVVVVGGGFLGSELVCALAAQGKKRGLKVTQIYPEEGNMAKVLPKYLSEWTTKKVEREGVNIISKNAVKQTSTENNKVKLTLENGEETLADHVIVCVGLRPNVELAQSAGLEIDDTEGGFRVNSELEARSDIWVAGDAACFYDINLGRRRVEHHDHAVVSGRLAGENMTGAKKSYKHQSMFWSDLGPEVGYEAIGICDSSLPTVGIWAKATEGDTPKGAEEATGESIRSDSESEKIADETSESTVTQDSTTKTEGNEESFGKGIVFYTREKKVVGILLWNIFGQMPIARKIVSEGKDHEDMNALAKLFKLH